MEKLSVIAKVMQPTEWCAGMVVVARENLRVRICVDPLPAVDQTLAQSAEVKVFSKLDTSDDIYCTIRTLPFPVTSFLDLISTRALSEMNDRGSEWATRHCVSDG